MRLTLSAGGRQGARCLVKKASKLASKGLLIAKMGSVTPAFAPRVLHRARTQCPSALLFCAVSLALGLGACRIDNPAFVGPQDSSGPGPGTVGPGASGAPDSEKGAEDGTRPGTGDTTPDATGSADSAGDSATPEDGTGPESAPGQEAARVYCQGAAICFPTHELAPGGIVQDLGPSGLAINFAQPVSLERNWADPPPLDHSIRLVPGSSGSVSAPLVLGEPRELAFDIWFSPENVDSMDWTLFEVDSLLSIERMSTGGLRCALKNGIVDVGPATNPNFEPGRLYHVACAIAGDRIMMWWNSEVVPYALPINSGKQSSFGMRLGASANKDRDPYSGRVAGIRIWNDVEQMRIKNNFPKSLASPR